MTQCENARWNFATSLVVDTQGFVRLSVCPSHYWFFGCHVHESKSGKTGVLEAFSRRHATLHLAVLVGSLVGRSVRHIFEFRAAFALQLLPNLPWLDCRVSGLVFFFQNGTMLLVREFSEHSLLRWSLYCLSLSQIFFFIIIFFLIENKKSRSLLRPKREKKILYWNPFWITHSDKYFD